MVKNTRAQGLNMPNKNYEYYITFSYFVNEMSSFGVGCVVSDFDDEINSYEVILNLANAIKARNNYAEVVITNWKLLSVKDVGVK